MVGGNIIFTAKNKKTKEAGIILLSPQVGDYSCIMHPSLVLTNGDRVEFYCPICHKSLTAHDVNENLVQIIMEDEKNEKHKIYFSGVTGEHCTYKISEENLEKYGEHSEKYYKYFMTRKI